MSILDQIFKQAKPIQPTASQWMIPKDEEWTKPIPAPNVDPFGEEPWRGEQPPPPQAIKPPAWMRELYADLMKRREKGLQLLDQPDLSEDAKAAYHRRIDQLAWQMHLLELATRELAPCPPARCPNRVGGYHGGLPPDLQERYVWNLKQAFYQGLAVLELTTPGGRKYRLVPWHSNPPGPNELDPLDLAAVIRVSHLAGIDALTLLDLLPQKEVSNSV